MTHDPLCPVMSCRPIADECYCYNGPHFCHMNLFWQDLERDMRDLEFRAEFERQSKRLYRPSRISNQHIHEQGGRVSTSTEHLHGHRLAATGARLDRGNYLELVERCGRAQLGSFGLMLVTVP